MFIIEGVDPKGKKVAVSVDAGSSGEAVAKVKAKGIKPMSVREKADAPKADAPKGEAPKGEAPKTDPPQKPAPGALAAAAAHPASAAAPAVPMAAKPKKHAIYLGRVRHKQLTQFTQQLSVLMDAGLPIVRSLKILSNQMKPSLLKDIVSEVAEDVETGSSLSEALAKHPKTFDKLYVNMVKAGEAGGVLDVILQRLAGFMERMEALKRKIIGASIYPMVVICIAIGVVMAIMMLIVPKFEEVFDAVHVPMPAMTQTLMAISRFVGSFWFIIILAPIALFFVAKAWGRTKTGGYTIDRIRLNLPVIGTVVRKSVIGRFCRTLGTLLQSGVPILEALNIVRNATGNEVVADAISKVHDSIREGESIAEPLAHCGVFDDLVINMIDVGEETGELDKMLLKIADNYDAEVDASVSAMMSVLEPLLIVGLGVTVGFIVVSLFLPLISLLSGLNAQKK